MSNANEKGQMPAGTMGGGMEQADSGTPRFRPPDLPPGTPPPPQWEPGIVEVEFHNGVKPEIHAATGASAEMRSPANVNLGAFNRILQQHRVEKVEPSFGTPPQEADQIQAAARTQGVELPNLGSFVTLHFPPDADVVAVAADLNRLPEVARAVPVPKAIPPQTPLNEPLLGTLATVVVDPATGLERQWYAFRCRANNAWARSSGAGVVIADIDWGYRISHQDLALRLDMAHAYNSYDGGTNVSHGDSISHGTAVMGIAGAADNDLGMASFAFGATLWPIQANSGPGPSLGGNAWARAIDWVRTADSGGQRKVIILEVQTGSFGNYEMVPSVNAAIRTAIASGVVVCVAAGNGDRDAGIDDSGNAIPDTGSILVGATEYDATQNRRAGFSNYNARVTVCAPGDGSHDLTCSSNGDAAYRNGFGGTSGATPKVAGTAALMLSVNPALTHAQIRTILRDTGGPVVTVATKPVGTFLNAEAAVRAATQPWRVSAFPVDAPPVFQNSASGNQNYEVVVRKGNGLQHYWFNYATGTWTTGALFGSNVASAPVMFQNRAPNNFNYEVLVREGSALRHYWFNYATGTWTTGALFGSNVASAPAVFQNYAVGNYNYEGVVKEGSALRHYWFNYATGTWTTGALFGSNVQSNPIVFQNQAPNNFNYEVLVREGSALRHYWFNYATGTWTTGALFGSNVASAPVMFQNRAPNNFNYEVLVREGSALRHYWFNYATGTWTTGALFGSNVASAPAVFQNYAVGNYNYEGVVKEGSALRHYWFNYATGTWTTGALFGSNVQSSPSMFQNHAPANLNYELLVHESNRIHHYWFNYGNGIWNTGALFG